MGLCYSKLLNTTFNSSKYSYNVNWSPEWPPTPKTFSLLRLPFLALLEIFKSLDPIELFILSQCSRKAASCIHFVGSKKWKLSVDVREQRININDIYRVAITESSIKPTWNYDGRMKMLFLKYQKSENSKLELQKVLSRLQAAFRCPVPSFAYTGWSDSDECWFSNQAQPLESLNLSGRFKNEDLKWVLENVKVSRNIGIYVHGMTNFTSNFQPICEQITFLSNYPIRLDLIKFKSCKYMKLSLSLAMHDLDVFMKEWKDGEFPNLQYMGIRNRHSNWVDGILGFRKTEMSQSRVRRRLVIDENLSVECTGGVDIQSDNGTKATMYMGGGPSGWFELSNPTYNPYSLAEFSSVSAKKIPLLRLPFFALLEIFKSLDPIELFILSQSSKKVANCVHIVGTKKWKLSVDVGEKIIIINDSYRVIITESSMKPTWKYDRRIKMFFLDYQKSENSKQELRKVLSQIQAAFRCPVTSFEYTVWCKSDQCWVSVLKCIIQNQVQPLESFVITRTLKTEDLEWALQNVKVTRKIVILTYTSRFPGSNFMMFKSCKYIELQMSWLKICALNDFMEEWKTGNFPSLRYMLIRSAGFHWNWYDHILGFKRDEMRQLGVRRRLVIDENLSIECTGGVDIQSDNGTKATMQMDREFSDWFELFILSQCSKRVANCVHHAGTKKWKLSVEIGNKLIKINDDSCRIAVIESDRKPLWKYDIFKTLFFEYKPSENSNLELQKVLAQLQATFRCPVISFEYTGWSDNGQCWFSVLKHISQNQAQPLESLDLCGSLKNEDLKWVFQNVEVTRKVNVYAGENPFSSDFQHTIERLELIIFNSCKYIKLALPSFTIHALDVFMKEWNTGSYPNLQFMLIKRCKLDCVDSILGFKRDELKQLGVPRKLVTDEVWAQCTGGVDIQADNGVKATMQLGRRSSDCKPLETASRSLSLFLNLNWSAEWPPAAKTFPLFRLPFFALLEVFKSLDPIELFILSQCSKRVANCVHIAGTKKWMLSVDVGLEQILINNKYRLILSESSQKPTWKYDKSWEIIIEYQKSENRRLELQKVLAQLQIAFRCPVTSFEYIGWCKSDQCWVSVLNCIIQNQVHPLESFVLTGISMTEDLEWALQNVTVTRKIDIRIRTSQFPDPNLMMFKSCKYIKLQLSWLKICALNDFMEEWNAGNFPNLQYMLIGSDTFHWYWYDRILGFKRHEMNQVGVTRRLIIDENLSVDCTGGVDIQAVNGIKATMQMDRESRNSFELFV
ncbi:unnamed protein product [Caenorhabditis brenneri]